MKKVIFLVRSPEDSEYRTEFEDKQDAIAEAKELKKKSGKKVFVKSISVEIDEDEEIIERYDLDEINNLPGSICWSSEDPKNSPDNTKIINMYQVHFETEEQSCGNREFYSLEEAIQYTKDTAPEDHAWIEAFELTVDANDIEDVKDEECQGVVWDSEGDEEEDLPISNGDLISWDDIDDEEEEDPRGEMPWDYSKHFE